MSIRRCTLRFASLACVLAFAISGHSYAADDEPAKKTDKPSAEAKDDAKDDAAEDAKDPYELPDGGVKELLAFIKQTMAVRPKTQQEAVQLRMKGFPAVKAAAEKILETAKDEDKQLDGFEMVEALMLYFRAQEMRTSSPADRAKLLADIKTYLSNTETPAPYALMAATQVASGLEYGGQPELAADAYRDIRRDPLAQQESATRQDRREAGRRRAPLGPVGQHDGSQRHRDGRLEVRLGQVSRQSRARRFLGHLVRSLPGGVAEPEKELRAVSRKGFRGRGYQSG